MPGRRAALLCLALLFLRAASCGGLLGAQLVCARGLTERQRGLCRSAPAAVAALAPGLSVALAECRALMAGRRWNCSTVDARLGHALPLGTREAAFAYALVAAGATHALSAACARGDLPACACSTHRRRVGMSREQFSWGGCGEAWWGARFARRWLDAGEADTDARAAMNLHNYRVGRKVVKELVRRECKCHGVSGSCAVRTCWRALPAPRAVGAALAARLKRARLVAPAPHAATNVPPPLLLRKKDGGLGRAPRKSELVFLQESPAYCEPGPAAPGTHGRHCNRSSHGEDGCEKLCCGRGYDTVQLVQQSKCRCRFHWCCSVACDTCVTRRQLHVCK